jgi:hypothetical protein
MAYTPTVWNDGDTITAERLNKLERGVANEQVGPQGLPGVDGKDGAPGPAGADGFSPTVSVTDITGGHRVTVTDADGPHTFDVMDGEDGTGGGTDGVSSFNGRTGAVAPSSGDYTAAMVGARPDTWTPTAADVGAATMEQVNTAIQTAVLDSWEGSY